MPSTFYVSGGRALKGTVRPAGNKNAALPILAATLVAGWLLLLGVSSDRKGAWVLRHFSCAILMFEVIDLMLLKHGAVTLWLTDVVLAYTRLIRDSHGGGEIAGLLRIDLRLFVFTIVSTIPLTSGTARQMLLPICQTVVSAAGIAGASSANEVRSSVWRRIES